MKLFYYKDMSVSKIKIRKTKRKTKEKQRKKSAIFSLVRIWKICHSYPGCSFKWCILQKHSYLCNKEINILKPKSQCKTVYDQYTYQRWIIRSWSVEHNLKVEYFHQKDLQRLTWQLELQLFVSVRYFFSFDHIYSCNRNCLIKTWWKLVMASRNIV